MPLPEVSVSSRSEIDAWVWVECASDPADARIRCWSSALASRPVVPLVTPPRRLDSKSIVWRE
jgi:hypothetical protein